MADKSPRRGFNGGSMIRVKGRVGDRVWDRVWDRVEGKTAEVIQKGVRGAARKT
jgi:hypothetical protein